MDVKIKQCKMWTDGSCSPNPGNGGWSAIIEYNNRRQSFTGNEQNTTNNRMEITPLVSLLPFLIKHHIQHIDLITDSRYLILGITNKDRWKLKHSFCNNDIWNKIYQLLDIGKVSIVTTWVKGHSKHTENNICDELASAAR